MGTCPEGIMHGEFRDWSRSVWQVHLNLTPMETLNNLEPLLRTFWYVAILSSLIFVIQTIMTFVGADATDGIEADFEGDLGSAEAPLQIFSLRNLINFLLGFSWTGISFYSTLENRFLLITLSFLVGIAFVWLFFLIINQLRKLAEDNSFKITETLNKTAEVYLTIPETRTGKGKVMVSVRGSFHELPAMTEGEKIPSGSLVRVARIENDSVLIVQPI
jgi:hypothetical protein